MKVLAGCVVVLMAILVAGTALAGVYAASSDVHSTVTVSGSWTSVQWYESDGCYSGVGDPEVSDWQDRAQGASPISLTTSASDAYGSAASDISVDAPGMLPTLISNSVAEVHDVSAPGGHWASGFSMGGANWLTSGATQVITVTLDYSYDLDLTQAYSYDPDASVKIYVGFWGPGGSLMLTADTEFVLEGNYLVKTVTLDTAGSSTGTVVGSKTWNVSVNSGAFYSFWGMTETSAWTIGPPVEVWVDALYCDGCGNDGHTWGYDAFTDIQSGIDAVEGSIVNVAAGLYSQRLIINGTVDLRGAQYGVDPTQPGARTNPANESIIDMTGLGYVNPNMLISVAAGVSNVSIDGFTLDQNQVLNNADECVVRAWDDHITVSNNIVSGSIGVLYKGNDYLTVDQNRVTVNKNGVIVQPSPATNVTISDNTFALGSSPLGGESAIYLTSTNPASITGNTATGFINGKGATGSNLTNVTVSGNTFTGNNDAVSFWGTTTFITISNNDLSGSLRFGVSIKGQDIDIENNIITGCGDTGVNIDRDAIDTERVTVYDNDLSGNANYGVKVNTGVVTETVDASANWWGSSGASAVQAEANGGSGADYTPWLVSGTNTGAGPGFEGDFSELTVDDDSPQTGTAGRIQEGIDLVSGSTVNVLAGTYNEQVEIGKAVDVLGAGSSTTFIDGTGLTLPSSGQVRITAPAGSVDFSGFKVENAAAPSGGEAFAILASGGGSGGAVTVTGIVIDNTAWGFYSQNNDADVVFNYNTVTNVTENPIIFEKHLGAAEVGYNTVVCPWPIYSMSYKTGVDNNDVTAKQWIHHNTIDASGGHGIVMVSAYGTYYNERTNGKYTDVEISYNTITNVGGAYQKAIQLEVDGDYGGFDGTQIIGNVISSSDTPTGSKGIRLLGDVTNTHMANNIISGFYRGIWLTDSWSNGIYPTGSEIEFNSLSGNTYGVVNNDTDPGNETDAEMNWWGDGSGPYHPVTNSLGTGDDVGDNIDYDPWIGKTGGENIVCVPDPEELTTALPVKTVAVDYLGGGGGLMYGYSVKFSWDGTKVSTDPGKVTQGSLLSDQGTTTFFKMTSGTNEITVDCALLGAQPGVTGPGTMFTVEFTGLACGLSDIDITINKIRDKDNAPLSGFYEDDGELIVDMADPVFTVNGPFPDGQCYKVTPVLDLGASDACGDLHTAYYKIGTGGTWTMDADLFTDYSGSVWSNAAWTLPGFAGLGEGAHTVYFYCTDDVGNTSAEASWDFIKDTIAPPAVTGFDAAPGNQKVHLSWTNPGSDFDHVVVVRKPWAAGAYPEYVQPPADGYPVDPSDGTVVYSGTGTSYDDGVVDRNIYFYHAFAYDCAGNYTGGTVPGGSIPPGFAQGDRATNYWLGDITDGLGFTGTYDGLVNFDDISALSAAYWLYSPTSPPAARHNECDVGPTDDYSRLGLPVPDDYVDFEDLMIFAMNYGVVTALGAPVLEREEIGPVALRLEPAGSSTDELIVSLVLGGNVAEVKGVSIVLEYDAQSLELKSASPSRALSTGHVFFNSAKTTPGEAWLDLAVLGTGQAMRGSGEVAQLVFTVKGSNTEIAFARTDIRGTDNRPVDVVSESYEPEVVPAMTRLLGARPNPFTPGTTLHYELGRSEHVAVEIYDTRGRLVRQLVDGVLDAGSYSEMWDGMDSQGNAVHGGIYFVKMRAGSYESTTKLVKVN